MSMTLKNQKYCEIYNSIAHRQYDFSKIVATRISFEFGLVKIAYTQASSNQKSDILLFLAENCSFQTNIWSKNKIIEIVCDLKKSKPLRNFKLHGTQTI